MLSFKHCTQNAEYLTIVAFSSKFDNIWGSMQTSFKKFECLQYYDEGENSPYHDLLRKDYHNFSQKLLEFKECEKQSYIEALSNGILLQRIHLIKFPITDYIKFEYYSYYMSNVLGENIFFDDIEKYHTNELFDFVLFDGDHMFIQDYNEMGKLQGAWYISDKKIIAETEKFYSNLLKEAHHFYSIYKPDKRILEMII